MKDHGETDRRGRGLGLDEDVSSCSGHFITFWLQFAQRFWLDFIFHLFVEQADRHYMSGLSEPKQNISTRS